MTGARTSPTKSAPWRGRPRVENPLSRILRVRISDRQLSELRRTANRAGLSLASFLRVKAFGKPDPRAARHPPVEVREIARLYGELGKLGSNVNQLAHHANATRALPHIAELQAMRAHLVAMHGALRQALGKQP